MATEVVHAIRTQAAWDAMSPSEQAAYAGHYVTLEDWQSAQVRDLVAADEIAVAEVFNDWPSGLPTGLGITGWTTDATRYVEIRSPIAERHQGRPNTGAKLSPSSTSILRPAVDVVIKGLEVTGDAILCDITYIPSGKSVTISQSIFHTSNNKAINFDADGDIAVISCAFINTARAIYSTATRTNLVAENCVAANCGDYGFLRGVFKNCVSVGHTSGDYLQAATGSDYNASSDATAPGANSITGVSTADGVDFVSPSTDDYHLASNSTLKGAGANLYDGTGTQTDIDGQYWPASGAWDIGSDFATVTQRRFAIGSGTYTGYEATYATLDDWQTAHQGYDWFRNGQQCVAEIQEDITTNKFTLENWTGVAKGYGPVLRCAPGLEHHGDRSQGVAIICKLNTTWGIGHLAISQDYAEIYDLKTIKRNTDAQKSALLLTRPGIIARRILAYTIDGPGYDVGRGIYVSSTAKNKDRVIVDACIVDGFEYGMRGGDYHTWIATNCVFTNQSIAGIYRPSNATHNYPILKNCVVTNSGTSYNGTYDAASTNNASDDAADPGNVGPNFVANVSIADGVDFVSPSMGDYHLTAGSVLRGAGVNLYDGTGTQTDIDGDPWPATGAWDIGADYFVSASGDVTVSLTGQDGAGAVGVVTASATANAAAALSTVAGFGGIGNILAEAGGSAVATLSAVSASAAVGVIAAYVSNPASVSLAGVESQSAVGSLIASGGLNASVLLSGNAATTALGGLAATGTASAVAVLAGVQLSGVSGNVVALSPDAAVSFGSVAAFAGIGSIAGVAINPDATVTIGTVSGNGRVGQLAADAAGLHGWVLEGGISASWGIESVMNSVWTEET